MCVVAAAWILNPAWQNLLPAHCCYHWSAAESVHVSPTPSCNRLYPYTAGELSPEFFILNVAIRAIEHDSLSRVIQFGRREEAFMYVANLTRHESSLIMFCPHIQFELTEILNSRVIGHFIGYSID